MLGFQGGVSIPLVEGGVKRHPRSAPVSSRAEGMARRGFSMEKDSFYNESTISLIHESTILG